MGIMAIGASKIRSFFPAPKISIVKTTTLPKAVVLGSALALGGCGLVAEGLLGTRDKSILDSGLADTMIIPDAETGIPDSFAETMPETISETTPETLPETLGETDAADSMDAMDTAPPCVPYTIFDTDFTVGTAKDLVVSGGSIILGEDNSAWTGKYECNELPESATPAWTLNTGAVFTSKTFSGGILDISTIGKGATAYYTISPGFDNTKGTMIETRLKINSLTGAVSPTLSGFSLAFADGTKKFEIAFFNDSICDTGTFACTTGIISTSSFHNYRFVFKGSNYFIYADDKIILDGTGKLTSSGVGLNSIKFGDMAASPDSSYSMDYLYSYNLGDKLPYKTPGTYAGAPYDTGVVEADHSGASIGWSGTYTLGQVSMSFRAANSLPVLSVAPWSSETTTNPAAVPSGITGQIFQWRITLNAIPTTSTPTADSVSGSKSCPE